MFDMRAFLEKEFKTKHSGNDVIFDCPFCEDKRMNYWFNPDKEWMHKKTRVKYKGLGQCFRCGKRDNIITFVMRYRNIDLIAALGFISGDKHITLKELSKMADDALTHQKDSVECDFLESMSVDFPKGSTTELPSGLVEWFEKTRSYPKEMLEMLDVRFCWDSYKIAELRRFRDRAIFPIVTNGINAWQAYLFVKSEKYSFDRPKTLNPSGPIMKNVLYLYEVSKNDKVILVCEGIFDALRILTRGFSPVALMGKNLSFMQSYILAKTKAKEVCMCLDGGEKERAQSVKNCNRLKEFFDGDITILCLPDGLDPDDVPENVFKKCYKNRRSIDSLSSLCHI